MSEAVWNKPFNYYDTVQQALHDGGAPRSAMQEYLPFYGQLLNNAILHASGLNIGDLSGIMGQPEAIPIHKPAQMGVIEPIAELMWHAFNRPTWFCDNTMLELLRTAKIDDNLSDIHWPAESLYICFEKGAKIGRFDLRSIMVFAPRSEITVDTVRKATKKALFRLSDVHCEQLLGRLLGVWVDCLDEPDYVLRPDGYLKSRNRLYVWRKYEEPTPPNSYENVSEDERTATVEAMHIAAAAMLYHSARPELVAPYSMPRSQRYSFRGERGNYRRLTLPGVKVIRDPSRPESIGTGSVKSPHYRGWVMRTLRDPRYRRKEDGTCRTVLIAPTAIHPELMGDNPEA
jgi:hypothetical protein